ncbi:MAG TPA: nuclear transport factor 2 family protein [Vicinamibacterales bacterium]|nr:nuclear transport factor 2 family protein [Vicinamibacterales bacterium]
MADGETLPAVLKRLLEATNAHDLEALTECFAVDYSNETPAHPDRNFMGREQVRRNWARIFAGVPDLHAELVRWIAGGDTFWAEWQHRGTSVDGRPHEMAGVTVIGVRDDNIRWARFYLEPVLRDGIDVEAAIRGAMAGDASR